MDCSTPTPAQICYRRLPSSTLTTFLLTPSRFLRTPRLYGIFTCIFFFLYSNIFDEPRRAESIDRECEQLDKLYHGTTTPTARDLQLISLISHNKRRSHRRLAIGLTVLTLDCSPRRHWTWNVYLLINLFKFSLSAFLSMEPLSTGVTSWSLPCSTLRSSPFRSAVAFRFLGDTASTPTILDHFPTFPYSFLATATTALDPQCEHHATRLRILPPTHTGPYCPCSLFHGGRLDCHYT